MSYTAITEIYKLGNIGKIVIGDSLAIQKEQRFFAIENMPSVTCSGTTLIRSIDFSRARAKALIFEKVEHDNYSMYAVRLCYSKSMKNIELYRDNHWLDLGKSGHCELLGSNSEQISIYVGQDKSTCFDIEPGAYGDSIEYIYGQNGIVSLYFDVDIFDGRELKEKLFALFSVEEKDLVSIKTSVRGKEEKDFNER